MALNSQLLLLTLGLLAIVNSSLSSDFVPVYLWQTAKSNEGVPALPRLSADAFGELIHNRVNKNTVLVTFAEPNLSPEDFNAVTQSGERVFNTLAGINDVSTVYLPQVQTPVDAVFKLFSQNTTTVAVEDFKSDDIESSSIVIDLNDVQDDEDRNHMLARHDKIIVDIYNELLKKYENVVALFTGRQASWIAPQEVLSRKVRDTGEKWIITDNNKLLLAYADEIPKLDTEEFSGPYTVTTNLIDDKLTAKITSGDDHLTFEFTINSYWTFTKIELKRGDSTYNFKVPSKMFPPKQFSYHCSNQVFYENKVTNPKKLTFKNLQIQPFLEPPTEEEYKFSDAYYCVGFTTPAIWSGIFITFLLATIMAIGLLMMMDMKTMDRFDDPKGKTIVVNVSE